MVMGLVVDGKLLRIAYLLWAYHVSMIKDFGSSSHPWNIVRPRSWNREVMLCLGRWIVVMFHGTNACGVLKLENHHISIYLHHEDIDVRYFSWIIRFCLNMPQRDRLQSQSSPTSPALRTAFCGKTYKDTGDKIQWAEVLGQQPAYFYGVFWLVDRPRKMMDESSVGMMTFPAEMEK